MADPLNPRHSDEEILASILRNHPKLTREKALEMAEAFGFDLDVPAAPPNRTQNSEPAPSSPAPKRSIVWPKGVKNVTAEKLRETLAIIGARRPVPPKASG
jgi:hypothetical protein